MNHARSEPSHDPLKASKSPVHPDKRGDVVTMSIRIGIALCLIGSISLVFHSIYSKPARWFPLPEQIHTLQNAAFTDNEPTNMSHILFGIGGSAKTWNDRSYYSKLWWDPNTTRGYVWLDKKPKNLNNEVLVPYMISRGWRYFKHLHSISAVRIARIVYESFQLDLPNVRWFVMGDDDTVFFTKNLVTVLGKYDHTQMYYIGANSESVEQDWMHSFDMAFGGGGFAISYALAAQLVKIMDGCLQRYFYLYGSDQRVWACVNEIGVPLTREPGFHQFDIRGDPYGILASHPLAPLVSLHHIDQLNPLFPNKTQIHSVKMLKDAYHADPARIVQQSVCYDRRRTWSISVSWGYTIQIYTTMVGAVELHMPLQTFKTWRSWSDGPFTFNVRPMSSDPCEQPTMFFLDQVEKVGKAGSVTIYNRVVKNCKKRGVTPEVQRIRVSALKLDPKYWKNVPRRQCCEIMDGGRIKNGSMHLRIRKCKAQETITM